LRGNGVEQGPRLPALELVKKLLEINLRRPGPRLREGMREPMGAKISRKQLNQCGGEALSHGERVG
jgi:hypothetical protein